MTEESVESAYHLHSSAPPARAGVRPGQVCARGKCASGASVLVQQDFRILLDTDFRAFPADLQYKNS